jgi:hypothetical protein
VVGQGIQKLCIQGRLGQPGFGFRGGGAFLTSSGEKNLFQCQLCGVADDGQADGFSTTHDINGGCIAYNYASRVRVDLPALSSLQGELVGSDLMVSGVGVAMVNGVPTNVAFDIAEAGGVRTFELRNADTRAVLASGTGEPGRADFELLIGAV